MQTLILLMAGTGSRVGLDINKMMYKVNNKRLYQIVLDKFLKYDLDIILVTNQTDYETVVDETCGKACVIVGGATRRESVANALKLVRTDRVIIHDAARVLVSCDIIEACINNDFDAYYVYNSVKDTIRTVDNITLDREKLLLVQTPQGGNTEIFKRYNSLCTTDDISSLEGTNIKIDKILGNDYNFKITTKFDLELACHIIRGEFNDSNR
jgi:2-C-methyl-D-erythritol 4-phosphate cytidylyltransferase